MSQNCISISRKPWYAFAELDGFEEATQWRARSILIEGGGWPSRLRSESRLWTPRASSSHSDIPSSLGTAIQSTLIINNISNYNLFTTALATKLTLIYSRWKTLSLVYETVQRVATCVCPVCGGHTVARTRQFPLFPGATYLCASRNWTSAGISVCSENFVLVHLPERHLFVSVLWQLHGSGLCCTVSSSVGDMDSRFTPTEMLELYSPTPVEHDSEVSRISIVMYI